MDVIVLRARTKETWRFGDFPSVCALSHQQNYFFSFFEERAQPESEVWVSTLLQNSYL